MFVSIMYLIANEMYLQLNVVIRFVSKFLIFTSALGWLYGRSTAIGITKIDIWLDMSITSPSVICFLGNVFIREGCLLNVLEEAWQYKGKNRKMKTACDANRHS